MGKGGGRSPPVRNQELLPYLTDDKTESLSCCPRLAGAQLQIKQVWEPPRVKQVLSFGETMAGLARHTSI